MMEKMELIKIFEEKCKESGGEFKTINKPDKMYACITDKGISIHRGIASIVITSLKPKNAIKIDFGVGNSLKWEQHYIVYDREPIITKLLKPDKKIIYHEVI